MKTEYFKVGQKVYHYEHGEGIVKEISKNLDRDYPVSVTFSNGSITKHFTSDGRFYTGQNTSVLSQTPYDLVNGGFTLKPLLPEIAVDTPVFVRNTNTGSWDLRYFKEWDPHGRIGTFVDQFKSDATPINGYADYWNIWSLEIPESR